MLPGVSDVCLAATEVEYRRKVQRKPLQDWGCCVSCPVAVFFILWKVHCERFELLLEVCASAALTAGTCFGIWCAALREGMGIQRFSIILLVRIYGFDTYM